MLELLSFGTQKSQSKPHFTMIFLKIMICCFSLLKTASYIHTMTRYANKNTSKYSVHFATQPVPIFCWVIKTSVHFFNAYLCYKIAINMTLNTLFVIAVPKVPIISRYFWYATRLSENILLPSGFTECISICPISKPSAAIIYVLFIHVISKYQKIRCQFVLFSDAIHMLHAAKYYSRVCRYWCSAKRFYFCFHTLIINIVSYHNNNCMTNAV